MALALGIFEPWGGPRLSAERHPGADAQHPGLHGGAKHQRFHGGDQWKRQIHGSSVAARARLVVGSWYVGSWLVQLVGSAVKLSIGKRDLDPEPLIFLTRWWWTWLENG
eukprot:Skav219011  [mRNA]  locus=scaffold2640:46114:46440:+ [translate_table: standard]